MAKTTVIFGESGAWKTTALYHAASYLYKKHRKKIRMITAEEWNPPFGSLVDAGIVDLVEFTPQICQGEPFPAFVKLMRGNWPVMKDGKMMLVGPNDPLNDIKNVCAYFIEGLTSISDVFMTDCREKGRKMSEEVIGKFTEGGINFGQTNRSHYMLTQNTVLERFVDARILPVERVIFSAHEAKGEDTDTKEPIRGPGLAGKAATDSVARKVGSMIHFEQYSTEKQVPMQGGEKLMVIENKVRAFFVSHPDTKFPSIKYKCKPRLTPELIPDLMKRFPGGYFEPTIDGGLDLYLKAEDEIEERAAEIKKKWKDEVLGGDKTAGA